MLSYSAFYPAAALLLLTGESTPDQDGGDVDVRPRGQ